MYRYENAAAISEMHEPAHKDRGDSSRPFGGVWFRDGSHDSSRGLFRDYEIEEGKSMKEWESPRSNAAKLTERETSETGTNILNRTQKNSPLNESELRGLPRISKECAAAYDQRYGGIPVSGAMERLKIIKVVD